MFIYGNLYGREVDGWPSSVYSGVYNIKILLVFPLELGMGYQLLCTSHFLNDKMRVAQQFDSNLEGHSFTGPPFGFLPPIGFMVKKKKGLVVVYMTKCTVNYNEECYTIGVVTAPLRIDNFLEVGDVACRQWFVVLAILEVGAMCFSCSAGEEWKFLKECFTVVLKSFTSPCWNFTALCFSCSYS